MAGLPWTPQEDSKLLRLVGEHQDEARVPWTRGIEPYMDGRTATACSKRYAYLLVNGAQLYGTALSSFTRANRGSAAVASGPPRPPTPARRLTSPPPPRRMERSLSARPSIFVSVQGAPLSASSSEQEEGEIRPPPAATANRRILEAELPSYDTRSTRSAPQQQLTKAPQLNTAQPASVSTSTSSSKEVPLSIAQQAQTPESSAGRSVVEAWRQTLPASLYDEEPEIKSQDQEKGSVEMEVDDGAQEELESNASPFEEDDSDNATILKRVAAQYRDEVDRQFSTAITADYTSMLYAAQIPLHQTVMTAQQIQVARAFSSKFEEKLSARLLEYKKQKEWYVQDVGKDMDEWLEVANPITGELV